MSKKNYTLIQSVRICGGVCTISIPTYDLKDYDPDYKKSVCIVTVDYKNLSGCYPLLIPQ